MMRFLIFSLVVSVLAIGEPVAIPFAEYGVLCAQQPEPPYNNTIYSDAEWKMMNKQQRIKAFEAFEGKGYRSGRKLSPKEIKALKAIQKQGKIIAKTGGRIPSFWERFKSAFKSGAKKTTGAAKNISKGSPVLNLVYTPMGFHEKGPICGGVTEGGKTMCPGPHLGDDQNYNWEPQSTSSNWNYQNAGGHDHIPNCLTEVYDQRGNLIGTDYTCGKK